MMCGETRACVIQELNTLRDAHIAEREEARKLKDSEYLELLKANHNHPCCCSCLH